MSGDPALVRTALQIWLDQVYIQPFHPNKKVAGLVVPQGKQPHSGHGRCLKVIRPAQAEGAKQACAEVICGHAGCNQVVGTKVVTFI